MRFSKYAKYIETNGQFILVIEEQELKKKLRSRNVNGRKSSKKIPEIQ